MSNTLNISTSNISGNCNLKCAYSYLYHNSNVPATNYGHFIYIPYDKSTMSPVVYNTNKYEVEYIAITSPSLHLFNNNSVDGEIIIIHTPVATGPQLIVYIPIIASGDLTTASSLLTQIITSVSQNAPAQGESTNINISNFNLNKFVSAKSPFFSYTQTGLSSIVFGLENAIPLTKATIKNLSSILNSSNTPLASSGIDVYYNPDGATQGFGNTDQIYIDCQPVNTSEEQVEMSKEIKNPNVFDLNNPTIVLVLQILAGCILFLILLFGFYYGLKKLSNSVGNVNMSNITKIKI